MNSKQSADLVIPDIGKEEQKKPDLHLNLDSLNLKKDEAEVTQDITGRDRVNLTNKSGGIKLSKQNFIFDHMKEEDDIRKDYQINEVIGSGAFGEVRKCMSKKTAKIRAVKIIKRENMTKTEQKQLETEINVLKQMDHPNIVKLFEAYKDKKRYFIVTELCSGGELFDQIIKRPYYSERDAAVVMRQIFSAVAYCHGQNIVHRDLKPENLLLESAGGSSIIKVIDFGTSQSFSPDMKMKQRFGTPYYIAPEVLKGSYDAKCDMWSCGVILYILISGKPPFDGTNDKEILKSV